jgi:anti-anti-sigma factor
MTPANQYILEGLHVCAEMRGRGVVAIRLQGELDLATHVALRGVLHGLDLQGLRHVDLDVSDLSFCDSRGCAVLLSFHHRARAEGMTVGIWGARPEFRRLIELIEPGAVRGLA